MKHYLEEFRHFLSSERLFSHHTVEAYVRDLASFFDFVGEEKIAPKNCLAYLANLQNRGYSPSTINRHLASIKSFFHFLSREGLVSENPTLNLESSKQWQKIPHMLSIDEVDRLLSVNFEENFQDFRDRAILELLYASGIRVSELCSLNIHDVDDQFLRVMGKGKKERLVPIGKKALFALNEYLLRFRDQFLESEKEALFVTTSGKRINRIAVWQRVREMAKRAKITQKLSPHILRHSFASHLLANGADIRIIQELLGHSHIATTDRYTQLNSSHIQEAFYRFHPKK